MPNDSLVHCTLKGVNSTLSLPCGLISNKHPSVTYFSRNFSLIGLMVNPVGYSTDG